MIETEQALEHDAQQQDAQESGMTPPEPGPEHRWLQKLVGEWTYELDAPMGPNGPMTKFTGTERVKSIRGLWVVAEGSGIEPNDMGESQMTLGYDPDKGCYVGTWLGSMMTKMWVYEGTLDDSGRILTLDCEGPDFENEGKTTRYKDVIELKDDNYRTLTARMLRSNGEWLELMTTHYRRAS